MNQPYELSSTLDLRLGRIAWISGRCEERHRSRTPVAVAARIAKRPKNVVTILPDSGERYLSTTLFEGVFDNK